MKPALLRLAAALVVPATLAALPVPVAAHRGHDAMSFVRVGEGGALSVSHRFETHDIEPALAEIAPEAQPSLDDPEAVVALKAYVQRRFAVTADGRGVELHITGAEIGASEVRIELAGTLPKGAKSLGIGCTILRDVYPGQVDQVVVDTGKAVRTLRFAGSEVQGVLLR